MLYIIGDIVLDNNLFYLIGMIVVGFGMKLWWIVWILGNLCVLCSVGGEKYERWNER